MCPDTKLCDIFNLSDSEKPLNNYQRQDQFSPYENLNTQFFASRFL